MGAILVDGREVTVSAVVRADRKLKFSALAKRTETRCVVLHHTGGSGLASQVHRTLTERALSVHFLIEPDGTIWQYADAAQRCAHAAGANPWSVGVEIVNPAREIQVGNDAPRQVVVESIHGHDVRHTTFTADQVRSALALTEALCKAYGLPHDVPMDSGDVAARVLSKAELETFRGVLGHLHLTERKTDPGLAVLRAIVAHGEPRAAGLRAE